MSRPGGVNLDGHRVAKWDITKIKICELIGFVDIIIDWWQNAKFRPGGIFHLVLSEYFNQISDFTNQTFVTSPFWYTTETIKPAVWRLLWLAPVNGLSGEKCIHVIGSNNSIVYTLSGDFQNTTKPLPIPTTITISTSITIPKFIPIPAPRSTSTPIPKTIP